MEDKDEGKTRRMPTLENLEEELSKLEDGMAGLLPGEFVGHMRAAQKEMILAMRSLLDVKLERIEAREKRQTARPPTKEDAAG